MNASGLACWLILCTYRCPSSYVHLSNDAAANCTSDAPAVIGWSTSTIVQTVFEILAQRVYAIHASNAQSPKGAVLPLVSTHVIPRFSWAVSSSESRDPFPQTATKKDFNPRPSPNDVSLSTQCFQELTLSPQLSATSSSVSLYHSVDRDHVTTQVPSPPCSQNPHQKREPHEPSKAILHSLVEQLSAQPTKAVGSHHIDIQGTPIGSSSENSQKVSKVLTQGGYTSHDQNGTDGDPAEAILSQEAAAASVRLVWTALLSYMVLDDVRSISPTGEISTLSWESSLQLKLESLSVKTVAFLHDLLLLCSMELTSSESEHQTSFLRELSSTPSLVDAVKKYILTYGTSDLESRFLCHPDIQQFISDAVEQGKLPETDQNNARRHNRRPSATETDNPLTLNQVTWNALHLNRSDYHQRNTKSNIQNSVYRHLTQMLPDLHDHFKSSDRTSKSWDNVDDPGYVHIYSGVPLGPLKVDFVVRKDPSGA